MNLKDGKALTAPAEDINTRLPEETKAACRRIIAANAAGDTLAEQVADAEMLMLALGVHPRQPDDDFLLEDPPVAQIVCSRA
jgi:hypothetical protein